MSKNRIGIIKGIVDGTIPEREAEQIMNDFPWARAGVAAERAKKAAPDSEAPKPKSRKSKTEGGAE